jgi:hypothetical protein
MTRAQAFQDRSQNHLLYKRLAKKLTSAEIEVCVDFIEDHSDLDVQEFERKASTLFLDNPEKPKNTNIMIELLQVANIAAFNSLKVSR